MPYGGKFLIRRSVRIIPAHKKHRLWAGVLLARRSTPANRNLSAARLSDILPGSYLLAEQSPGSSQLQTPPGVQHPSRAYLYIIKEKSPYVKGIFLFPIQRKSQAKNAVLFQQTILRYFVHFWQHEKATRQSPAGSLCFIVLFPCYFRVLCVRFSLKYERTGAARPPPPSTRPAPCSHSARLKPSLGSCSSRFGFA